MAPLQGDPSLQSGSVPAALPPQPVPALLSRREPQQPRCSLYSAGLLSDSRSIVRQPAELNSWTVNISVADKMAARLAP